MMLSPEQDCLICEQCGRRGPVADDFRDMMRLAVMEAGFGYSWEHHPGLHTAHFFCPACKLEFNCEVLPCL